MKIDFNYSSNKTIIPAIKYEDSINNAIIANLPFLTEFRTFNATMKSPTDLYLYTPDGNLIRKVPKNIMIGQGNVQGNNTNSYAEINFRSISGDVKNINVFLDDHYSKKFVSQEIILHEIIRDFSLFKENTLAFFYGKNVTINLFINLDLQNHFNKYEFNCSHISTFLNDGVVCEQQIYFVELAPTSDYSFVKRLSELYIGTVKSFSSEGFVRELQIPNVIWFKDDAKCMISYNNERGVLNAKYNSSESYEFSVYLLVHNPLLDNEIKIGSEIIVVTDDKPIFEKFDFSILEELFDYIVNSKTVDVELQRSEILKLNPFRFMLGINPLLMDKTLEIANIEKIFASKLVQYIIYDIQSKQDVLSDDSPSPPVRLGGGGGPYKPSPMARQSSCM
jgi:hypothetical protein